MKIGASVAVLIIEGWTPNDPDRCIKLNRDKILLKDL